MNFWRIIRKVVYLPVYKPILSSKLNGASQLYGVIDAPSLVTDPLLAQDSQREPPRPRLKSLKIHHHERKESIHPH
jgi:hypothetical protein